MNEEIEKALAGIRSAWKNMLAAEDKETFDAWTKETKEIQKVLNQEKRRKYLHFRNTSEEYRASRRSKGREKPGRPPIYKTDAERRIGIKKYQHEYYLKVTKQKRAERRIKNEKKF